MTRKQFLALIAALLVLGGAGLALMQGREASWHTAESKTGQTLLKNFQVNDVAQIAVKSAAGVLNLANRDGLWRIKQRGDYPANFSHISDLLIKLQELKIVQSDPIAAEQRARFELLEPGKGKEAATAVTFADKTGKPLASLLLGKKYMRKAEGTPDPGYPAGRYVLVGGDEQTVAMISNPLLEFDAKPEQWIDKTFVKFDKLKSITATGEDGAVKWKLNRDKDGADWQLADKKPKEDYDKANGVATANALSTMSFVDVAVDAKPQETGLDKPASVIVETFDNLTYLVKIGKAAGENAYLAVSVSGEPAKQRTPQPNEKPEDKEKLDQQFKAQLGKLEARIKTEKALANWVYLVPKWKVDALIKERAKLMVEKAQVLQPVKPDGAPQKEE